MEGGEEAGPLLAMVEEGVGLHHQGEGEGEEGVPHQGEGEVGAGVPQAHRGEGEGVVGHRHPLGTRGGPPGGNLRRPFPLGL